MGQVAKGTAAAHNITAWKYVPLDQIKIPNQILNFKLFHLTDPPSA